MTSGEKNKCNEVSYLFFSSTSCSLNTFPVWGCGATASDERPKLPWFQSPPPHPAETSSLQSVIGLVGFLVLVGSGTPLQGGIQEAPETSARTSPTSSFMWRSSGSTLSCLQVTQLLTLYLKVTQLSAVCGLVLWVTTQSS